MVFGDGVRLPAATSSSGGETIELLKTPNMANTLFSFLFFLKIKKKKKEEKERKKEIGEQKILSYKKVLCKARKLK